MYRLFSVIICKTLRFHERSNCPSGNSGLRRSGEQRVSTRASAVQTIGAPLDRANANRYAYAANDPISLSDPLGLITEDQKNDLYANLICYGGTVAIGFLSGGVGLHPCVVRRYLFAVRSLRGRTQRILKPGVDRPGPQSRTGSSLVDACIESINSRLPPGVRPPVNKAAKPALSGSSANGSAHTAMSQNSHPL